MTAPLINGVPLPDRLTVNIFPGDDVPGQWIAEILELDLITQGNSVTHAIWMASDALRCLTGECSGPSGLHCWCRENVIGDEMVDARECCRCEMVERL